MRDFAALPNDLPMPIGEKVVKPAPTPAPVRRTETETRGVFKDATGKLFTDLPLPVGLVEMEIGEVDRFVIYDPSTALAFKDVDIAGRYFDIGKSINKDYEVTYDKLTADIFATVQDVKNRFMNAMYSQTAPRETPVSPLCQCAACNADRALKHRAPDPRVPLFDLAQQSKAQIEPRITTGLGFVSVQQLRAMALDEHRSVRLDALAELYRRRVIV